MVTMKYIKNISVFNKNLDNIHNKKYYNITSYKYFSKHKYCSFLNIINMHLLSKTYFTII